MQTDQSYYLVIAVQYLSITLTNNGALLNRHNQFKHIYVDRNLPAKIIQDHMSEALIRQACLSNRGHCRM